MGRKPSAAAAAAAAIDHESLAATMPADLLAAADCGGIHGHALFFDALVQLIPPRFYLPSGDEDRPWYQGLSKAAKAAMKAQSRANVKAARRARLDPSAPPASTLDLLKKSVAGQAAEEEEEDQEKSEEESEESGEEASSEDNGDEEDGDEEDERPIAPAAVVSEDRSVTYEELRERLQRRIAELRGNRCTRPEFLNKPKKEKGKKSKANNEKKGKGEGKKRKRDDGTEDVDGKDGKKVKKGAEEKPDIMYANVFVDPKEARRRKKRRVKNKKKALEQAKRLQEAKKDPEKACKIAWDTARRRAAGEKVHDDPKLIKESLKKEEKRQQKHAAQWKERHKTVDKQRKEKQKKRTENIRDRAHQKKMRKIEKREKKLMRPGFEGRMDGYVNE
ncbi:ribosomal RNA-processing protein 14-C-like [Miscanthus floridulus]|uniref:ribosomal RNA-processing protein 14-C-like n=1 Tax=Miscanthus floridulus TaxID=154761 RepID=UPI0034582FFD